MDASELRLLRCMPVFMRERSVSRAAEAIGLSQPAASQLLGRLRVLLGDPLLLRSRNGMVPTQRALELEKEVRELIDRYDRLTRPKTAFDPQSSRRSFHITAPEFAERMLVPKLLRVLCREAPNVRVVVHAPDSDRSLDLLERGEIDLRVAWLIPPPGGSLRSVRLFQDKLVCIADERNTAVTDPLDLDTYLQLGHLRTLGYSQTTTGKAIDGAIRKHGHDLRPPQLVQNFATLMQCLSGTDLIATVPRLLADEFNRDQRLRIVDPPVRLPTIRYAAYWHERNQADAGHRWFRLCLAEVGRRLGAEHSES